MQIPPTLKPDLDRHKAPIVDAGYVFSGIVEGQSLVQQDGISMQSKLYIFRRFSDAAFAVLWVGLFDQDGNHQWLEAVAYPPELQAE